MSEEPKYTEGICGDGAAILKDGERMTISEIIAELNIRPDSNPYKWKNWQEFFPQVENFDSRYKAGVVQGFNAGRERKDG